MDKLTEEQKILLGQIVVALADGSSTVQFHERGKWMACGNTISVYRLAYYVENGDIRLKPAKPTRNQGE